MASQAVSLFGGLWTEPQVVPTVRRSRSFPPLPSAPKVSPFGAIGKPVPRQLAPPPIVRPRNITTLPTVLDSEIWSTVDLSSTCICCEDDVCSVEDNASSKAGRSRSASPASSRTSASSFTSSSSPGSSIFSSTCSTRDSLPLRSLFCSVPPSASSLKSNSHQPLLSSTATVFPGSFQEGTQAIPRSSPQVTPSISLRKSLDSRICPPECSKCHPNYEQEIQAALDLFVASVETKDIADKKLKVAEYKLENMMKEIVGPNKVGSETMKNDRWVSLDSAIAEVKTMGSEVEELAGDVVMAREAWKKLFLTEGGYRW